MSNEPNTADIQEKLRRTYHVHIDLIEIVPGYNRRTVRERKVELKRQIEVAGQVNFAITAFKRDGKYYVNHGHGRVECLKELLAENVPVSPMVPVEIIKEPKTDEDKAVLLARQIVDNDGENLRPIDAASIIQELRKNYSWKDQKIADYLGKTAAWVGQTVRLLDLSEPVQDLVAANKISGTQASEMIREFGAGEAENLITEVVNIAEKQGKKKATKKDVEKLLNGSDSNTTPKSSKKSEPKSKKINVTNYVVTCTEFLEQSKIVEQTDSEVTLKVPAAALEAIRQLLQQQ